LKAWLSRSWPVPPARPVTTRIRITSPEGLDQTKGMPTAPTITAARVK
jgi:hypothetical protein